MSIAIPQQIQYSPSLPVLPAETVNTSVIISPSNGNSFTPSGNNQMIFDLGSSNYCDPATLTLRFKLVVNNATTAQTMFGGGFSVIQRLETLFGSQVVETINNYNVVYNDFVALQFNLAQKANLAISYGFLNDSTDPTLVNIQGRLIPAADTTVFVAIPLVCLLSSAEKLIPLGMMNNIRIQLTLDSIANIFSGSTVTNYTITNAELSYDMIRFGAGVDALVRSMGEKIYIKSQSMSFTGSSLTSGSSGNISLIYNQRLSSIKGLLAHFSGLDAAKCVNKAFDSVDITTNNGSVQFFVNSIPYPTRAIDLLNNKAVAMSELRNFVSGFHTVQGSNMSITPKEWAYTQASTTATTSPAKFFVATNTEKIQDGSNALLSGISTSNSPISVTLSLGTATGQAMNVLLLCLYDVLIEVDTIMKSATIKQ